MECLRRSNSRLTISGYALASIAGSYIIVYAYDVNAQRWYMFAPDVPAPFADLVNTLHGVEYAHNYWVYATQPVTLYLGVTSEISRVASSNMDGMMASNAPLAPATYYGWITPSVGFTPTVGMRVIAKIDGTVCGETLIQQLDGKLAYLLQVAASDPSTPALNCGARNKEIVFNIDNWVMDHDRPWDNSHASSQSLSIIKQDKTTTLKIIYLPYIRR